MIAVPAACVCVVSAVIPSWIDCSSEPAGTPLKSIRLPGSAPNVPPLASASTLPP